MCHSTPSAMQATLSTEIQLHTTVQTGQGHGLGRPTKQISSCNEKLPTELHEHIQHIHFSNDRLNIMRGAIKYNPI